MDHLGEATGLKHGGDGDDVAAGVDEVAQRLIVAEAEVRILAPKRRSQRVELGLPLIPPRIRDLGFMGCYCCTTLKIPWAA